MSPQQFYKKLAPVKWGTYDVEPLDSYRKRVSSLLPNWPACPLEHWLYRHYSDAIREYAWLGFDKFSFQLFEWSSIEIYEQIGSHKMKLIDGWGHKIFSTPQALTSQLQKYFKAEGTWPVPLILLENNNEIVGQNAEPYGSPYHLLEGHLRLGYFRNIYRQQSSNLKTTHMVWVVSL